MKRLLALLVLSSTLLPGLSCKQEPVFDDIPLRERLAREWKLSAEEAQPGRDVYRTTKFQFPVPGYRPGYRFAADQQLTISHRLASGSERWFPSTWQLSEDEQVLTIVAVNPYTFRALVLRWRIINLRSDLLLVEPQP